MKITVVVNHMKQNQFSSCSCCVFSSNSVKPFKPPVQLNNILKIGFYITESTLLLQYKNIKQLMLFKEIIIVYCENHKN
jgi:hypothetical protein